MAKGIQRSTPQLRAVLEVLLRAGPNGETYGFEVAEQTGLLPGSIYPILQRLHSVKWVTKRVEKIDPHEEQRPPRIYYSLTSDGAQLTCEHLAARRPKTNRAGHLGLAGNGGDI